jgi:hypothetical protein
MSAEGYDGVTGVRAGKCGSITDRGTSDGGTCLRWSWKELSQTTGHIGFWAQAPLQSLTINFDEAGRA